MRTIIINAHNQPTHELVDDIVKRKTALVFYPLGPPTLDLDILTMGDGGVILMKGKNHTDGTLIRRKYRV